MRTGRVDRGSALPTLSVIIPCCNTARFVCDAVRSVVDQGGPGVECLLVDDGSTDGSAELVRAAFGSRVRIVRQENQGVAAARNRGFREAAGELIAWLDADDMLAPGTLPARRAAFAADPRLEMLLGQVRVVDIETGVEEVSPQRCDADYLVRDLLARTNLPHLNVLTFRRDAVARLGPFDGSLRNVDDFDYWIRAFAALRWRFARQVQSTQRIGTFPSLSRSVSKAVMYGRVGEVLRKNRGLLGRATGSDRPWRRGYSRFAADFALVFLRRGERAGARRWAATAIVRAPLAVERRAWKYLLESVLPGPAYRVGRAAVRVLNRLRPARRGGKRSRHPAGGAA